MDKDLIRGVILVFLTCISFVSLVSSNENKKTGTCCSDGLGLNYTLPMVNDCKKELHSNGSMVQTIPKLIPYTSKEAACPRRKSKLGIPPGHRVCKFPDCGENTCQNGSCEETMTNFKCHCSAGYQGKHCNESYISSSESTSRQETPTMSTTESTTCHPATTTPSTTSREATTNSMSDSTTPSPTTATKSTAKVFLTVDGINDRIFVTDLQADLVLTSIPSTSRPRYMTYDSVEKKIYWTDKDDKRVYRADEDGGNRKMVTSNKNSELLGIAIAESSRTLYIAYKTSNEITTVDIGQGSAFPGSEATFETRSGHHPKSLVVDEEQGFLYWSMSDKILRKFLNGSGSTETVYHNNDLSRIGLSIDLSRDPRRIFFGEFGQGRTFYMDVDSKGAHELTDYMNDSDISGDEAREQLRDISYFNGVLYWAKGGSRKGIAIMTDYDQSSPSFYIKSINVNHSPFRLLIIKVNP